MLKKLIRYEFSSTYRFMLLIYSVLLGLSLMIGLGLRSELFERLESMEKSFHFGDILLYIVGFGLLILFVIMSVVVMAGTFFYAIKRFYENILGNEGYLMHTLPVKHRDLVLSKTLVFVLWSMLSVIVMLISYTILLLLGGGREVFEIIYFSLRDWIGATKPFHLTLFIVEGILVLAITYAQNYLHIYASMAMGFSRQRHRILFSVLFYMLLNFASSTIGRYFLFPMQFYDASSIEMGHTYLFCTFVSGVVFSFVFYFIAENFLRKKLNLL